MALFVLLLTGGPAGPEFYWPSWRQKNTETAFKQAIPEASSASLPNLAQFPHFR
jgi:hypothetical protein